MAKSFRSVERAVHHIDARGVVVGRAAVQIAHLLQGKHKPTYEPWADCGDEVVVTNATRAVLTGRKWYQKVYRYHTGWVGGLKEVPVQRVLERKPEVLVEHAVYGMLPRNRLRRHRMKRLHVFGEEEIPPALARRLALAYADHPELLPASVAEALENGALWREEVYDPKVHAGFVLDIKEDDEAYEFVESRSEGHRKFKKGRHIKPPRMFKGEVLHNRTWDRAEWDSMIEAGMSPQQIKDALEKPVDSAAFRARRRWLT